MGKQLSITLALDIRPASEAVKSFVSIAQLGGTQIKAALAGQLPAPNLSLIDAELGQLDISLAEYIKRNLEAAHAVDEEAGAEDRAGDSRRRNLPTIPAAANSIAALQERHSALTAQLRASDLGTQRFKELSIQVAEVEVRLRQAQEAQAMHGRTAGIAGAGVGEARQALTALNYTIRDSPYLMQNVSMGIMAISNNLPMLVDGFAMARQSSGSFAGGLKLLWGQMGGIMGISLFFSLLMAGFQAYSFATMGAKNSTDDLGDSAKKAKEELEGLQTELERFKIGELKALEIDVKLRGDIKAELKKAKEDLKALTDKPTVIATQTTIGGLAPAAPKTKLSERSPEDLKRITELNLKVEGLERNLRRTDALKQFQDMIFSLANAAGTSEVAILDFARANNVSEAMIQATITSLREGRDQLELNSQAYRDNVAQADLLERTLSKLKQTQKETFDRSTEAALGMAQASYQLGTTDANETVRQLEVIRSAIEASKELTDVQRSQLLAQVDSQIGSIKQTQIEAMSALAQVRVESMKDGQEKELLAIQVRYQAERLRIQTTYKDKVLAGQMIAALNQKQANEETELLKKNAVVRQNIENQIAELKAGLIVNETDREIALINLQAGAKKRQIQEEIQDETLRGQYLQALEMDRLDKIQKIRLAHAYEWIQTMGQAIGQAGGNFIAELLQGGDADEDFELRMLEFREQEEALRKDRSMSDEERELRLRSLARQRHDYEMRNAQTLAGRVRNTFVSAAKGFGQALVDAVNRMIAELLAKEVVLFLLKAAGFSPSLPEGTPVNNPVEGLPMAAEGAIVNQKTLLWAGEAGPEAIIPLPKLPAFTGTVPQPVIVRTEVTGELRANGYELRALINRVEKIERRFK